MAGQRTFTIGEVAKNAGVNIQTVRFYERQKVLEPVSRKDSGYRMYNEESLKRLNFIRHAKDLGFSLKEIHRLLSLRIPTASRCAKVRAEAKAKLTDIQEKLGHLKALEKTLKELIKDCEGKVVSSCCPILEKMEVKHGKS